MKRSAERQDDPVANLSHKSAPVSHGKEGQGAKASSRTLRLYLRIRFAGCDLGQDLGRKATSLEIAAQLGMPVDTVDPALSVAREPIPMEGGADDPDGYDVAAFVPDERAPSPFHCVARGKAVRRVESALIELTPREETIVRMRFGIGHEVARTLEQIGAALRLSRERVRQIEWCALAKMRASPLCRDLGGLRGGGVTVDPFDGGS